MSIQDPIPHVMVVLVTVLCDAKARLSDLIGGNRDYDTEVVANLEALSRQTEDALLAHQLLQELHFVLELGEMVHFDAHHHVHGTLGHNGTEPRHVL